MISLRRAFSFLAVFTFFSELNAYEVVDAYPGLEFDLPVAVVADPGNSGGSFIVEKKGKIFLVAGSGKLEKKLFLDISDEVNSKRSEQGLLGLAFHPDYSSNRHFYVFYVHDSWSDSYNRLSRFTANQDSLAVDPDTELVYFDQEDDASNHNGGDLHFGPDGYLYVSLGDEGRAADKLDNSQLIDKDFFAGILRIDVDKRPGSLEPNPHSAIVWDKKKKAHYSVPADNPFVGIRKFNKSRVNLKKVRTEFWAVGLRNPWRMSFDPATGDLYCGDVGQGALEEIDIIVKGGNYGWAWMEASKDGNKADERIDGVKLIPPIFEYGRDLGVSVTGGVVYHGDNCPELKGAYIFADYAFGNIWSLRKDTGEWKAEIIAKSNGISGFGVDPVNGDVLMANHNSGKIERITR